MQISNSLTTMIRSSLLFAIVASFCLYIEVFATDVPMVSQGEIDLSSWNFAENKPIELNGEWEFFPGQLLEPAEINQKIETEQSDISFIPVPDVWKKKTYGDRFKSGEGTGTYRLRIDLGNEPPDNLAFILQPPSTASRVYINGRFCESSGTLSGDKTNARPEYRVKTGRFIPVSGVNEILIQVSNFHHADGGMRRSIIIGTESSIRRMRSVSAGITGLIIGGIVIIMVFHMFIYIFRRNEPAYGLFVLTCLLLALRYLSAENCIICSIIPSLPWEAALKIDYLTLAWMVCFFFYFFRAVFPSEISSLPVKILTGISSIYSLFVIVAPAVIYTRTLIFYHVINIVFPLYLLYVIIIAVARKRIGAKLFLFSFIFLYGAGFHDILLNHHIIRGTPILHFGIFLMVFCQAILLSRTYQRAFIRIEHQLETFLLSLATAIESKDSYTGGHVERVSRYSRDIARAMEMDHEEIEQIYLGAIVHDVGKIGVSDAVLNKPGKLTAEEFDEIKQHTTIGNTILSKIEENQIAASIAHYHQEKWDGSGYPSGLAGEKIPVVARIVSVADYWDSIVTDRPYRKAMPLEKALEIIKGESGKSLDPHICGIFIKSNIYRRYLKIAK